MRLELHFDPRVGAHAVQHGGMSERTHHSHYSAADAPLTKWFGCAHYLIFSATGAVRARRVRPPPRMRAA